MTAQTLERPRGTDQRTCTRYAGLVAADSMGDDRCLSCGRSPGWLERSQAQAPKVPKSDYGPGVHPEEAQRDFAWYRARLDVEEAERARVPKGQKAQSDRGAMPRRRIQVKPAGTPGRMRASI